MNDMTLKNKSYYYTLNDENNVMLMKIAIEEEASSKQGRKLVTCQIVGHISK